MKRLYVELCSAINISTLQKSIRKIADRDYPDSSEEEIFNITATELNKFKVNDQSFKYTHMNNNLGGYRWFFICEKCGKRARKLFLPPKGYPGKEHKYLCRLCHNLVNESVIKGNNSTYMKVIRPLRKLKLIEEKLERGHIPDTKIEELLDEYDEIEKDMKNTLEYRLYAFKKKRGISPT